MIEKKGDMMERFGKVDCFIVCVDSCIRSDGTVNMMNHMAVKLSEKHPTLPAAFGQKIAQLCGDRGLFYVYLGGKVGMFQNMVRRQDGANLEVISQAVQRLHNIASETPQKTYALEWPAHGCPDWMLGRMLHNLPDNVEVWWP